MAIVKLTVLVIIFAYATVFLLRKFSPERPLHGGGFVKPGFEEVADVFSEILRTRMVGGAFAVYYKGKPVVDLWGGYADPQSNQTWEKDTLSTFFSGTKGVASLCIGHLVSKGIIKYDDPVTKYWPEFGQNGKEALTLRTLLNHEAGLISLGSLTLEDTIKHSKNVGPALARQKPYWEPGTGQGYHALTFGLYVDQIIRRADPKKRNISQYFQDEIGKPLNLDFSIGLKPEDHYRATRLQDIPYGGLFNALKNSIETWSLDNFRPIFDMIFNPDSPCGEATRTLKDVQSWNNVEIRMAMDASYSGHGTARALAKLYGKVAFNGAVVNGNRLISKEVLAEFVNRSRMPSRDKVMHFPMVFSCGMAQLPTKEDERQFGHLGMGGQAAYGNAEKKIGWAFTTNDLSHYPPHLDPRMVPVVDAMYRCVDKLEASEEK